MLWANLHLLFWLSLVSFATGWMGENHFAARPVAQGNDSHLAKAIGKDIKGIISVVIYAVAVMWLIPDRRIEKTVGS